MKIIRDLVLVSLLAVSSVFAHDDGFGTLVGDKINLFYTDHAISGHVNEVLVYASPLEKEFGMSLTRRLASKDYVDELKAIDKEISGKVGDVAIAFTKIDAKGGTMEGTLDGDAFKVVISSKEMVGNHYVNPQFDVTLPKGNYHFQLDGGMACLGCSVKITYVVLGMLRMTGAL